MCFLFSLQLSSDLESSPAAHDWVSFIRKHAGVMLLVREWRASSFGDCLQAARKVDDVVINMGWCTGHVLHAHCVK
jgi:hypothetical protein